MQLEAQIPKIIHWCWLGGGPVPEFLQQCMESWRRQLPDYTIKCWTQQNFDIHSIPWVEQAVALRKWAFAADYIRLYALYNEGGIYLDSDVEVLGSFEKLRRYDFFSGAEISAGYYKYKEIPVDAAGIPLDREAFVPAYGIQAAIMGAKKGNGFLKECLSFYEERNFQEQDGRLRMDLVMPQVIAKIAEQYNFRYLDKDQMLARPDSCFIGDAHRLPSAMLLLRPRTIAFHHCAGSWTEETNKAPQRLIGGDKLVLSLKYTLKDSWNKWRKALRKIRKNSKQTA